MFLSLFRIPQQNSHLPLFLQPFMNCEAIRQLSGVKSVTDRIISENLGGFLHSNEISCK